MFDILKQSASWVASIVGVASLLNGCVSVFRLGVVDIVDAALATYRAFVDPLQELFSSVLPFQVSQAVFDFSILYFVLFGLSLRSQTLLIPGVRKARENARDGFSAAFGYHGHIPEANPPQESARFVYATSILSDLLLWPVWSLLPMRRWIQLSREIPKLLSAYSKEKSGILKRLAWNDIVLAKQELNLQRTASIQFILFPISLMLILLASYLQQA